MASKTTSKIVGVLRSDEPTFEEAWHGLCARERVDEADLAEEARRIVEEVRSGGDPVLFRTAREMWGVELETLEVGRDEWDDGCERVDGADRAAIGKAAMRVREFHRKRIPSSWEMREEGGAYMGHKVRPLDRVAVVTGEDPARHPSRIIMNAIPASVVEVPDIVLAAPAGSDGRVAPQVLIAARVAGVHRVLKLASAHAVAAFAHGTVSVPRVDMIVGPGDALAEAAKQAVTGFVGLASEGGCGELAIVADRSATASWVAADMVSKAEAQGGGRVLLITHMKTLANRVQDQIGRQVKGAAGKAAKQAIAAKGAIVVSKDLDESIALANRYAAEHLQLAVENSDAVMKRVTNAGTILLGHYTPLAIADLIAGPNGVLPRGGSARFSSPLGVEDFLKRTSFVRFEPPKLRELGQDAIRLAGVEGLAAGAKAVDLRLQKIRRARREREAAREADPGLS